MTQPVQLHLLSIHDSLLKYIFATVSTVFLILVYVAVTFFAAASRHEKIRAVTELLHSETEITQDSESANLNGENAIRRAVSSIVGADGYVAFTAALNENDTKKNDELNSNISIFIIHPEPKQKLVLVIHWNEGSLSRSGDTFLAWSLLSLVSLFCIATIAIFQHRNRILLPALGSVEDLQKQATIAKTTQMLAHDVRKPFMICRQILGSLIRSCLNSKVQLQLESGLIEVNRATEDIENLISDILEIGATSRGKQDAVSPDKIIERVIIDAFKYASNDTKIDITYDLRHNQKILANATKIRRVFANIVANAVEAMDHRGRLWIASSEKIIDGRAKVEFCVGNSGRPIDKSQLNSIFDIFYTTDKKDGTGLGLAIAKKIINDHGGEIRCRSSVTGGTEFIFDIPASTGRLNKPAQNLPRSSSEARNSNLKPFTKQPYSEPRELVPLEYIHVNFGEIDIAVIDDSIFYLEAWKDSLKGANVHLFLSPQEFFKALRTEKVSATKMACIITDYYFSREHGAMNGIDFAKKIHELDSWQNIPVLLATNAELLETRGIGVEKIDKEPVTLRQLQTLIKAKMET